jgi:hypothetical protein
MSWHSLSYSLSDILLPPAPDSTPTHRLHSYHKCKPSPQTVARSATARSLVRLPVPGSTTHSYNSDLSDPDTSARASHCFTSLLDTHTHSNHRHHRHHTNTHTHRHTHTHSHTHTLTHTDTHTHTHITYTPPPLTH